MVTTKRSTAEDLLRLEDDWPRFELIEGELVELTPPSAVHASIVATVTIVIGSQILQNSLGQVYAGDAAVLLHEDPDIVLGPDVAMVAADRLPLKQSSFMTIPPDWAIEVASPGNTHREIERKIRLYLAHGVKSVWIIYPHERQVVIHTQRNDPQRFTATETIAGIEPFPGISVQVSGIFH
ncbi:Uma2 family endonuclease [soil metagenome]